MQNNAAKGNPSVKNCPEKSGRKPIIVKAGNAQIKIYRSKTRGYDLFTLAYYSRGNGGVNPLAA
jgi:hypothetical protein